jgi:hypothetical protein
MQAELEDYPPLLPPAEYPKHRFSLQAAPSPQCHLRAEEHRGHWSGGVSSSTVRN